MSHKYKLKFMFDWGSGVCLWSADRSTEDKLGDYPIELSDLPVSQELEDKLEELIEWHDEALNWDDPGGDLLWDDSQISEFLETAKRYCSSLQDELSEEYEIEFIDHI